MYGESHDLQSNIILSKYFIEMSAPRYFDERSRSVSLSLDTDRAARNNMHRAVEREREASGRKSNDLQN